MKNINKLLIALFLLSYSCAFAQPCPVLLEDRVVIINDDPPTFDPPIIHDEPHDLDPPVTDNFEEDRVIAFVHGLGGNTDGWVPVSADIDDRYRAGRVRLTYTQQLDLNEAGKDIHLELGSGQTQTYMNENEIEPIDNFIIGHSQGGLVARAAYKRYKEENVPLEYRNFGGIVTLCTSHNGAKFLEILDPAPGYPGQTPAGLFADNALKSLSKGPILELVYTTFPSFLVNWFEADERVVDFVGKLSEFVTAKILPIAFGGNSVPIADTYKPGAEEITKLNEFGSLDIPSVSIWARESDPLFFRALFWILNEPAEFGKYGATDGLEDQFIDYKVETNIELYRLKRETYNILAQNVCTSWEWFWHPNVCGSQADVYHSAFYALNAYIDQNIDTNPAINVSSGDLTSSEAANISSGYAKGYNWFLSADNLYKDLVGALKTEVTYACECELEDNYGNISYITESVNGPNCDEIYNTNPYVNQCDYVESGFNIIGIEESDGSVLKSSALAFPGASNNEANIVDNAFHMQARNHPNLRTQLDILLAGNMDGLTYFFTTPN